MSTKLNVSRECTPVVDASYDPAVDERPATAIVEAVAAAEQKDPTELPSLYDCIDTDALNRLFAGDNTRTELILSFTIDDWNVFVSSDGRIRVCDATRPTEPAPVFENSPD